MIILTASQANTVRGNTSVGAALDPILHPDNVRYCLPEAVLSDPAHAVHHAFLSILPTETVTW